MKDISIIIVNYNTPELVIDCLRTIERETSGIDYEVIVIDNASPEDNESKVMKVFPAVRWISMGYNAGFARANNVGIRQSGGDIVLLLNSDTLVEAGAINGCFCLFRDSSYVACGVQLLNADRTPQISGNYTMKGGLNYLLALPYMGGWIRSVGQALKVAKPHVAIADGLEEVDWINGAFLMVKKIAIERAGLMDEDFFLYAEEAEWCSRLKKQGRLCIFGQFHVLHLQGASANDTFGSSGRGYYNLFDHKGLQIMLSNFVRIRKQFGIGWFLVQLFFYVLDIPVFMLGLILSWLFIRKNGAYSFRQFAGFCKNIGFTVVKSPTIIRNKPHFYKVL